jgi:hypothetical protein
MLDKTNPLYELTPVCLVKETKTVDAVPYGYLISGLGLCLGIDHLLNSKVILRKSLFDPIEGKQECSCPSL